MPTVDEVQAKANAQVLANGEAAWKAMLEARKKNAATGVGSSKVITEGRVAPPLPVGGGRSFDDTEAVKHRKEFLAHQEPGVFCAPGLEAAVRRDSGY